MTTLTIKTAKNFNIADSFAHELQSTVKKPTAYIAKDLVTGETQRWFGSGFVYDAEGHIISGKANKLSIYDAAGTLLATAQFAIPWDFATQGYPETYGDLLVGDDVVVGGAGDDVLGGGHGEYLSIPDLVNTGVGLADGQIDYNYSFTNLTGTATGFSGYAKAAVGIGWPIDPWTWVVGDSSSQWLIPTETRLGTYADNNASGDYKYSLKFDLSGYNPDNASFSGRFSADNYAVVKLNGVVIAAATDYLKFYNFSANEGFVSGVNTLDFIVTNYGSVYGNNPTGLRVEFTESNVSTVINSTFKGGLGNDTYTVDSAGDKVIEQVGQGTDSVNSTITYKLTPNVENLTLTGTQAIDGLGNSLANVIIGNVGNNILAAWDGNDTLTGGGGDDTLNGGKGMDTATYEGLWSGYKVEYKKGGIQITDINPADGDEGVDTLVGVERLQMGQSSLQPSQTLFQNYGDAEKNQLYGEYHGYYRFFFDLSSTSYVHTGLAPGLENPTLGDMAELWKFQAATATNGFALLSANELGLPDTLPGSVNGDYRYLFKDGFYDAYLENSSSDTSSVAVLGRTSDALFITFRGTDGLGDWLDDAFDMQGHYDRYDPLFDAIDNYIAANGINKVYVSGHSLGGQMASMYMADSSHQQSGVEYNAVTFEAANKHIPFYDDYANDGRLINFEMYSDPVPDLWFDNYGKTIHISNGDQDSELLASTHGMGAMQKAFNMAITAISKTLPSEFHTRVYVDSNNDGNMSTDHTAPLLADIVEAGLLAIKGNPALTITESILANLASDNPDYSATAVFAGTQIPVVGLAVSALSALVALTDEVEYLWTGYDVETAFKKANSTLTVDSLYLYLGSQNTVHIDDINIGTVDVSNTLPFTGFLAPSVNIDASNWSKKYSYTLKISGNGASNTLTGSAFADVIRGEAGNDVIYGGEGNDVIDRPVNEIISEWASGGDDTLYGGKGNDVYFVNSTADLIVEKADEGNFDAVIMTGNRGLSEYFNSKDYLVSQNIEIAIARDDRTLNPSENFSMSASGTNKHYLIGNAGNNKIVGGDGADVLVGGGDVDLLVGGNGNDILFGGVYAYGKSALGNLPTEVSKLVAEQADARPTDSVDVGYYMGGFGADTLIGELSETDYNTTESDFLTDDDGDNDYFFIDVNLANNNSGNIDTIQNFYVAGADPTADDWLVFSAQQLGLTETYMEDTLKWDKETLDVFGKTVNSYNLDFFTNEHFFKVNGIADYTAEYLLDDEPAFILDYSEGGFYFDRDGDRDVGDQVQVADISRHPHGDNLADLHANQILVVSSFDLWA